MATTKKAEPQKPVYRYRALVNTRVNGLDVRRGEYVETQSPENRLTLRPQTPEAWSAYESFYSEKEEKLGHPIQRQKPEKSDGIDELPRGFNPTQVPSKLPKDLAIGVPNAHPQMQDAMPGAPKTLDLGDEGEVIE